MTKEIDEELVAGKANIEDVAIDQQHDDIVDISRNLELDSQHGNPGDPADQET